MMENMIELAIEQLRYSTPNLTTKERYFNHIGRPVPSVTEVIHAMIHKDTLMRWANAIGLRGVRYDAYMDKAAAIGTAVHTSIEKYVKDHIEGNSPSFQAFMTWYNIMKNGNEVELLGSELQIVCPWFGGTCDMLVKVNGKVYLVDFKTSNHISYEYFIQLGAYKYLIERELHVIVDGGLIVLQLDKKKPIYNEFIILMEQTAHRIFIENAERAFLSLLYAYYMVTDIRNRFDSTFGADGGYK